MKIDWDKLRAMLPVYAYEYGHQAHHEAPIEYSYWRPFEHKGETPPPGWINVEYDESYENLMRALSAYLKLAPTEKAVWFNNDTGEFSNSWIYDTNDKTVMGAIADQLDGKNPQWKLIIYRCESDSNFEFSGLMKIVTNTERRK
jgi:hypothetical protein